MHGDHESESSMLPPFIARRTARDRQDEAGRPLPPWTSARRDLPGVTHTPREAPWEPAEPQAAPNPWSDAPQPSGAAEEASEPWPGDELEPVAGATDMAHDDGTDPWASQAGTEASDPWAADAAEQALVLEDVEPVAGAPLVLGEAEALAEEPLVLDTGDESPWLEAPTAAPVDEEPWPDETEEATWSPPETAATDAAEEEPWAVGEAGPEPAEAAPDWTAALEPIATEPPAARSPMDELVETAGQALAGSGAPWAETPLATWPGEADAWDAAAAGGGASARPEAPLTPAPAGATGAADDLAGTLERMAAELRLRGDDALRQPAGEGIALALASFLAGWRAARGHE